MVVEYVSGIKAAWEVAKSVKTATDAIDDAHLKLQMAELISALADAKMEATENAEIIAELKRQINTRTSLKYIDGVYFKPIDGADDDGPFCPTCFDSNSKEIRLKDIEGAIGGDWKCLVCSNYFQ
ncbi:hypothetical protein [Aliivibrio fischeri]|uniref:hypothetical protein n=1 Tax=Aliivibrio fischeri TaxID=668 RepID=UPI0007C4B4BF|nr:hypothetical protein [Aliivibrio fischeri]